MGDRARISIDQESMNRLIRFYGEESLGRIQQVTLNYTEKVARDAKTILRNKKRVDTGRTVNSISPNVRVYSNKVIGQVNSATKYARFIHEGAEHESDTVIVAHFVPFKIAPSLLLWAKRKRIIFRKNKKWYMKSKRGKEYRINLEKGGLPVLMEPTLFFETPFNRYKDQYLSDVINAMLGR